MAAVKKGVYERKKRDALGLVSKKSRGERAGVCFSQRLAGACVSCVSRCWWRGAALQLPGEQLRFWLRTSGSNEWCSTGDRAQLARSQRKWSAPLSIRKRGNAHSPESGFKALWPLWSLPERLLPWGRSLPTPNTPTLPFCTAELTRRPQTDWLVLWALWLDYIVNIGSARTLTAFSWLDENSKT